MHDMIENATGSRVNNVDDNVNGYTRINHATFTLVERERL